MAVAVSTEHQTALLLRLLQRRRGPSHGIHFPVQPRLRPCRHRQAPRPSSNAVISAAGIRLDHRKSVRTFKGILATTFLSSSLTCPATQSDLSDDHRVAQRLPRTGFSTYGCVSPSRHLHRPHPQGREACRLARSAVEQIRTGDQPSDRADARARRAADAASDRRRSCDGMPRFPRKCVLGDTLPNVLIRFAKTSRDGRRKNNSGCPLGSFGASCWGHGE